MATVLFVGSRAGATRAARRLGVEALVLAARRPRAVDARRFARVDPGASVAELVAAARTLSSQTPPDAVIALTERAVVPAAHARVALGLPGPTPAAAAGWNDKVAMKRAVRAAGIRCASWVAVDRDTRPAHLIARLGLPMVIKPRRSSGSRGAAVVRDPAQLAHVIRDDTIAEGFVRGTEMSVEAMVSHGRVLFRSTTRYLVPLWANLVPAPLPAQTLGEVDELLHRSIAALGVHRGMVHLELFLGPDGPVFGEMAVRPPGGHIMDLIEIAWGFDPWDALIRIALGEQPVLPREPRRAAGAWILHPGPGVVSAVHGLAEMRRMPGVVDVQCRVGPGDQVHAREGSGNEVGRILVAAADPGEAIVALREARQRLTIAVDRPPAAAAHSPSAGSGMEADPALRSADSDDGGDPELAGSGTGRPSARRSAR